MNGHPEDSRIRRLSRSVQYYTLRFVSYHIATYAASASFFIITAIFPLLIFVLSILSLTGLSTQDFLEMVAVLLPDSLEPTLSRITENLLPTSATTLSLSLVATLWTASKSMLGLLDGLNAIADVNDTRNFLLKRAICMVYMLVMIAGLMLNMVLRVFGLRILSRLQEDVPGVAGIFSGVMDLRGLTLFLLMMLVFMLIYTFFPGKRMHLLLQIPGAAFASAAWLVFSWMFSIYVNQIGQFSTLYGGLTMLIFAMLWLYFCMYIVFIGAFLNKIFPEWFWSFYLWIRSRLEVLRKKQ